MLSTKDINTIKQLLTPLENKMEGMETKMDGLKNKLDRHTNTSQKEHKRLQNSINIIVDDLGEDVTLLKEKTKRIEKHLGYAQIA